MDKFEINTKKMEEEIEILKKNLFLNTTLLKITTIFLIVFFTFSMFLLLMISKTIEEKNFFKVELAGMQFKYAEIEKRLNKPQTAQNGSVSDLTQNLAVARGDMTLPDNIETTAITGTALNFEGHGCRP